MIQGIDSRIIKILDSLEEVGHPVLTSGGVPFEWRDHNFLLQPLADFHPKQGINKCSQVGFSEMAILKAFYAAQFLKYNVLYTLPTEDFVLDFVPPKVDKILEYNPGLFPDVSGGVSRKSVGSRGKSARFVYFKGAYNPKPESKREEATQGTSYTTDLNIHDEASKSDPFILSQMISRYQNSKYQGRWLFDNPVYPKMGADAIWQKSDQMTWTIKCSHCGYYQYLDWFRLDKHDFESGTNHVWINAETKTIECGRCRKPITKENIKDGDWIARWPSVTEYRGYWINQLMYTIHSVQSILDIEEDPMIPTSTFYNMALGKPYIGTDVKLSRENIVANISNEVNRLQGNAMGIDQGVVKHYVIGNEQGIFLTGNTKSWEDLELLWKKYNAVVVCDALPTTREPKKFAAEGRGRFYRAFYKPESDQAELAKFIDEVDDHKVLIRRHETFDELVNKIVSLELPIQMNVNDLGEFIDHWTTMVRMVSEDKHGNQRFEWTETGPDHLAHATLYFYIARLKAMVGSVQTVRTQRKGDQNRQSLAATDLNSGGVVSQSFIKDQLKKQRK